MTTGQTRNTQPEARAKSTLALPPSGHLLGMGAADYYLREFLFCGTSRPDAPPKSPRNTIQTNLAPGEAPRIVSHAISRDEALDNCLLSNLSS